MRQPSVHVVLEVLEHSENQKCLKVIRSNKIPFCTVVGGFTLLETLFEADARVKVTGLGSIDEEKR